MLINPEQEIVRSIERLLTLPGAVEYGQLADGLSVWSGCAWRAARLLSSR